MCDTIERIVRMETTTTGTHFMIYRLFMIYLPIYLCSTRHRL